MGRCQGRYCASVVARMTTAEVGEFGLFAPRPPAKPVPIRALTVEQPEWTGHKDFVPPDMARPRDTEPLPTETVDTLVIGGGVAGSCLAYWLAREGIEALVVERDDVNLQASGANAGSLHVQLLAFDFALGAPPNNRAADTLPLGPASVALWQEIQRDTGEDLEMKVCGGLMLAENERDIDFLKGKIALEKSHGIEAELIGANELRALEPCIGDVAIAAEWCPGEGKINPLKGTYAVVAKAKALGARFRRGSNVVAIERDGTHWKVTTSRGEIRARRVVNTAGPWAAEVARLVGVEIPVRGAPLADGRHRADGADALAPRRLRPPPSHPEADGLGRLHDRRRLDGGAGRAEPPVARAAAAASRAISGSPAAPCRRWPTSTPSASGPA